MKTVDKAQLFAGCKLDEDTIVLAGIGPVLVRELSRTESMRVSAVDGTEATERLILHLGMVEPALTESEAGQWMAVAGSKVVNQVSVRIAQLSGMLEDSAKAAYKSDGDRTID